MSPWRDNKSITNLTRDMLEQNLISPWRRIILCDVRRFSPVTPVSPTNKTDRLKFCWKVR